MLTAPKPAPKLAKDSEFDKKLDMPCFIDATDEPILRLHHDQSVDFSVDPSVVGTEISVVTPEALLTRKGDGTAELMLVSDVVVVGGRSDADEGG